MKQARLKPFLQGLLRDALIYLLLAALLYWVVADDWSRTNVATEPMNRDVLLPEMTADVMIEQSFVSQADKLVNLSIQAQVLSSKEASKSLKYRVLENDEELTQGIRSLNDISDDGIIKLSMEDIPAGVRGKQFTLELSAEGGIACWSGTTRSAGKFDIEAEKRGELRINGVNLPGELVMWQEGYSTLGYTRYYWPVVIVIGIIMILLTLYCHHSRTSGKMTMLNRGRDLIQQYWYLLKTLVVRDFKVRYKASVLGVIWSFLNPLLMTFVYYFVFSTIFRSSIPYFPVYLMSGIVLFNYFSEATNMGMLSIVGNAGLITKVYMPKYIFPISKAISSGINLIISMIPLMIMMVFTGVPFHKSILLIPIVVFFLVVFCVGVSLILSACMVYFRDIQFLWGIMLTVLNFFSPIFYPESIIPARFITLYHCNPLYQYMFFMRTIVIGGISPTPITYLYCALASFSALGLGLAIFRKAQSQFVLHL